MSTPIRFGSAVSLAVVASLIAGCATPQRASVASTPKGEEIGLASRAVQALAANDPATAISFAERAVARTPDDVTLRTLLGNVYFSDGRFLSAEGAYKDSLALSSNQPQVILKLALVETALGKRGEALAFLHAGRDVLDAADYGLALALAGETREGVAVLDAAARNSAADGRVRQNLALALALSGDWTNARTIAAQDVPANQVDARIQQWMQLANPKSASDQVAALVGVTPALTDQGRPERLALVKVDNVRTASAAPVPVAPVAVAPAPAPQLVAVSTPAEPGYYAETRPVRVAQPVAPSAFEAAAAKAAAPAVAALAAVATGQAPAMVAAVAPKLTARLFKPAAAPKPARAALARPAKVASPRVRNGQATTVVQLGAYASADRVLAAWNNNARKFPAVRAYRPMSARFSSPKGTFYRLSVKGFASSNEAAALCSTVRRSGGSCFVRQFAGDTPVQIASR